MYDAIDEFCNATAEYTIDYSAEADAAFAKGIDITEALIERVMYANKELYDSSDDIGGIIVFYFEDEIVGFYDYEQFVGRFE